MHTWQLQKAKSHLSEVVDLALTEGAQMVTRRGKDTAVLLSATEYQQLTSCGSLKQLLLNAPRGDALEINRSKEQARDIDL